jgi:hypothetical protein
VAVSVEPTRGVPVTVGSAVFVRARTLKCRKPVGQRPLERVIRAHEKVPPQLSWDTMISLSETTFSTYATWPLDPAGGRLAAHQAMAPTVGTESRIFGFAGPQLLALPLPVHGRVFGSPALTIR